MSKEELVETLRGVEFLRGVADEYLEQLAEISREVEFPAQQTIFQEHETAHNVFVVVDGQVSLVICTPAVGCRQIAMVGDGELVGWSPLVKRPRLSATARTITRTKAIEIDGQRILGLCAASPQFGFEFMHRTAEALAQRLSATRVQLLEVSGVHLPKVQIESD